VPSIELPTALTDDVVTLRPLEEGDVPAYVQAFRDDPTLGSMMGMELDPTESSVRRDIAHAPELRRSGRWAELAVTHAKHGTFLGVVVFHGFSWADKRAEFSAWLAPDARGHGHAARAARIALGWAFETLGLARVEMSTTTENRAAQRFARNLGFTYEGTMRARNVERGRPVDVLFFGLLREDWLERRNPASRRHALGDRY